jgi:MOSC domain-containing protein YiiM
MRALMNPVGRLVSIQVGKPTVHGTPDADNPLDRPWRTAFFKSPILGAVRVGRGNLDGDGQANLKVHGGPDKAVLSYAASHYAAWRLELAMPELPYGAFAENFTIDGLDEQRVCMGDVYAIGPSVRVQVSQPRQPCLNISHRWRIEDLTQRVEDAGRTGWYQRVLVEGMIEPGLEVELVERPAPDWTVARATLAMRRRRSQPDEAAALAAVPWLSEAWRERLSVLSMR